MLLQRPLNCINKKEECTPLFYLGFVRFLLFIETKNIHIFVKINEYM